MTMSNTASGNPSTQTRAHRLPATLEPLGSTGPGRWLAGWLARLRCQVSLSPWPHTPHKPRHATQPNATLGSGFDLPKQPTFAR